MSKISYWLLVETPDNWGVDQGKNFRSVGISNRFSKAAHTMKRGDILVTYVSKKSAFAGVRHVDGDAPTRISGLGDYDRPLEWEIKTSPLLVPSENHWVKAYMLLESLELTRGKRNWGMIFFTAVRSISAEDGRCIVTALEKAVKAEASEQGSREP